MDKNNFLNRAKKFSIFLLVIFVVIYISGYLFEKISDKFPELIWILIIIWILSFFYKTKTSESYIANADKIKAEIDSFVENEICLGNNNLLKKYKNSSNEIGYGLPPLGFTKLVKDIKQRNKYCELSIAMIQERIKFHEAFIREFNLDPKKTLPKTHTIIAISLVIGAIVAKLFGLTWGVIIGAIAYWIINEYPTYLEKSNLKQRSFGKRSKTDDLNEINSITKEWQDLLNQFQTILNQ